MSRANLFSPPGFLASGAGSCAAALAAKTVTRPRAAIQFLALMSLLQIQSPACDDCKRRPANDKRGGSLRRASYLAANVLSYRLERRRELRDRSCTSA